MRAWCTFAAVLSCVICSALPVRAQEVEREAELSEAEQTALARDLFEQGVRAARRAQWEEAADRFSRALALKETPQIRYNLAESLFHLGRLVEASEQVARITQGEEVPPAVTRSASDLSQRLERDLGRLTIRTRGGDAGATVMLDDREVPRAVLGVERPVDPGRHVVRLTGASGEELDREEIEIEHGGSGTVRLEAPAAPTEAALAPTPTAPTEPRVDESGGAPWWLWAGLAVLAVGAAAGAVVLFAGDGGEPTQGSFMPGIIEVR